MSTVKINNAAGVDYDAYIAALGNLSPAEDPAINPSAEPGGDTIIVDLDNGLEMIVYGEFSGTKFSNGNGDVYKIVFQTNDVLDATATWDAGHRFTLNDIKFSLIFGTTEELLTTDPITFFGNVGNDLMVTGDSNDRLVGAGGSDVLTANGGEDRLDGGNGADFLYGGGGNDTYLNPVFGGVNGDTIGEDVGGGDADVIESNATISIAGVDNLERVTLTGGGNISATGNDLANVLTGNTGNNTLTGGIGADILTAGDGTDTLNGGADGDTMRGGNGNDTYVNPVFGPSGDKVIETASGGTADLIESNATIKMATAVNVERLTLTGTASIHGTGNSSNNVMNGNSGNNALSGVAGSDTLIGNDGNDSLSGGAGKDILIGGAGTDTMDGGTEADTFRFAVAGTGLDKIVNFQSSIDRFDLAGGTFSAVAESAGNTVLTHSGGKIIVAGFTGLDIVQWNNLVLPAGGSAGADQPAGFHADAANWANFHSQADYFFA